MRREDRCAFPRCKDPWEVKTPVGNFCGRHDAVRLAEQDARWCAEHPGFYLDGEGNIKHNGESNMAEKKSGKTAPKKSEQDKKTAPKTGEKKTIKAVLESAKKPEEKVKAAKPKGERKQRKSVVKDAILADIKAHPWSSQKAIADRIGKREQAVNAVARKLVGEGVLKTEVRKAEGDAEKKTYSLAG